MTNLFFFQIFGLTQLPWCLVTSAGWQLVKKWASSFFLFLFHVILVYIKKTGLLHYAYVI